MDTIFLACGKVFCFCMFFLTIVLVLVVLLREPIGSMIDYSSKNLKQWSPTDTHEGGK